MSENVNVELIDECYNCFNDGITKIGKGNYFLILQKKNLINSFRLYSCL